MALPEVPSSAEYMSFPQYRAGRISASLDMGTRRFSTPEVPPVPPSRSDRTYPVTKVTWSHTATGHTRVEETHYLTDDGSVKIREKITVYGLDHKMVSETVKAKRPKFRTSDAAALAGEQAGGQAGLQVPESPRSLTVARSFRTLRQSISTSLISISPWKVGEPNVGQT